MLKIQKYKSKLISLFMIILSIWTGIRIFDIFLDLNDKELYKLSTSTRKLDDGRNLYVSHPIDYDISSLGNDTIVFIGDSFGEGVGCGNDYNIAGCLKEIFPEKRIINLSKSGKSAGFYRIQLKNYIETQRNDSSIKDETIFISLYSNDINLDKDSCEYFNLNKSLFKNKISKNEIIKINKKCTSLINSIDENFENINQFRIPFRRSIINIFGFYSFLYFREILAQISLEFYKLIGQINTSNSFGRASYIPKWSNPISVEFIVMAEILKDIVNLCEINNCKLNIVTFPNVEDLNPKSKVRASFINFGDYMKKNYSINIYDGYEPFIERGIKVSKYSLTNIHSNCNGYRIYAGWISNFI